MQSYSNQDGLSINVYKPTINILAPSYNPTGTFIEGITTKVSSFSMTSVAIGGYWKCSFSINDTKSNVEEWLERLGNHIEVYNPDLVKIWEGFIDKITITTGPFTVARGPFSQIANKVSLVYSTVDTTVSPPAVGTRAVEGPQEDTTSQEAYGIIEKVLSTGGIAVGEAADILSVYLEENKNPQTSKTLSIGQVTEPTVSVECLGYAHFLKLFTSNDTTTGTRTIPLKIQDILGDDPNGLFSTDYSGIDPDGANGQTVARYENDNELAWGQIKGLVSRGDGTDRWIFGVYNDRKVEYDIMPDDYLYQQLITSPSQIFLAKWNTEILPWDIRPAKWVFFPDFLTGKTIPEDIREDPRMLFIESVTFNAPRAVSLSGGKVSTLNQILASKGISGIG